MSNDEAVGSDVASVSVTSLKPGPPLNAEGRVIVIVDAIAVRSHALGTVHSASIRPFSTLGFSSARSAIQPSLEIIGIIISRGTRSLRALGGDTTTAYGPCGGLP